MKKQATWLAALAEGLAQRKREHQLRELRVLEQGGPVVLMEGQALVNLASNDYLGLTQHPLLRQAAIAALEKWGVGAGSSRLVGGTLAIHAEVEAKFAAFKHAEAALLCPTGYMANHAVLTSLSGAGDLICLDKLSHASLIDAARASAATVRVFGHRDLRKLERLLAAHGKEHPAARRFIVTDSIFSMDGDAADLVKIVELGEKHQAITVVDEAHGTGVLGETGAGLCEAQGVSGKVDVVISTASKALGCLGGMVTGKKVVIDTLVNQARAFIYTTSVPPAQAAAIGAALDVIQAEPERRRRVLRMAALVSGELARMRPQWGMPPGGKRGATGEQAVRTPILPLVVGSSEAALDLAKYLRQKGFYAPAIRPPTVPRDSARVRISLRSDLADAHIEQLLQALRQWPG